MTDRPGPNLTPGFVNEPGSTSEQLPPEILAAIDVPPYLSTACDTAARNKYTGAPCACPCHPEEA